MYLQNAHPLTLLTVLAAVFPVSAGAAVYPDPAGDTAQAAGHHMDIVAVEVTNDGTNLYFDIDVGNNPAFAADAYARFMVGFDTVAGGDSAANAWHNKISMPGMDFFGGGWTDSGSGAAINYHSRALGGWPEWQNGGAGSTWIYYWGATIDANGIQFGLEFAQLGLRIGDTFTFDVYTGWEGGTAMDALGLNNGTATQLDWSSPYNSGNDVLRYTIGGETWAGYTVISGNGLKYIDTESFMGFLEITNAPWLFSYKLGKYIYLPEEHVGASGGWAFIPGM